MRVNSKGKTQPIQCLLDTGCSKSIILKKFTKSKQQTKQCKEDQVQYATWGGSFDTHCKASVGFRLVEFEQRGKQTVEHKFQVDGTKYPKGKEPKYDMVIGSNLLWKMSMIINFKNETLDWDGDKIPLKINGTIQDKDVCKMLYSMHTNAPIIQEAEERAEQILDANYSKVNIDNMVDKLQIDKDLKGKLKKTLKKFPTLFG